MRIVLTLLFAFFYLIIAKEVFEELQLGFLIVRHTYEDIDGNFGYFFKKLKEHDNYVLVD
jgi:hypothetical protein